MAAIALADEPLQTDEEDRSGCHFAGIPIEKPIDRPVSTATARLYDQWGPLADFENEFPYLQVRNISLVPASSSLATGVDGAEETESEKLAFRMEIITLINPNAL